MTETIRTQAIVIGASIMALGGMALGGMALWQWGVPSFTGDGNGVAILDFLHVLEEVGRLAGWTDAQLIGIACCKMVGAAYDFAWNDEDEAVAAAKTYAEFKDRAGKRFDTEPECEKLRKFMSAKQKDSEDVPSFATRLRTLGNAAVGGRGDAESESYREILKELLNEQLRTQFLNGLRDPIKRFTLSRDPKPLGETVDAAVREERNERAINSGHAPIRSVQEGDRETDELRVRLERVERSLVASIELQNKQMRDRDNRGGIRRDGGPVSLAGSTAIFQETVSNARALEAKPEWRGTQTRALPR